MLFAPRGTNALDAVELLYAETDGIGVAGFADTGFALLVAGGQSDVYAYISANGLVSRSKIAQLTSAITDVYLSYDWATGDVSVAINADAATVVGNMATAAVSQLTESRPE